MAACLVRDSTRSTHLRGKTMTKAQLTASLHSVSCKHTDDIVGGDQFYVCGGAVANGAIGVALTIPMRIAAGQTLSFPTDHAVFFRDTVDDSATLSIGLNAFDQDLPMDWRDRYNDAVFGIQTTIKPLTTPRLAEKIATATAAIPSRILEPGESDDRLGQLAVDIPLATAEPGIKTWHVTDRSAVSSWDYQVTWHLDITRL
ncbi:hypothetical protein [Nocardia sp. NPDC047038]|uniref:hypothetical protein n=1 Tax=Nocardia sp. NPDC047038 TaxID=3154338 RepID=UPI0033CEC649